MPITAASIWGIYNLIRCFKQQKTQMDSGPTHLSTPQQMNYLSLTLHNLPCSTQIHPGQPTQKSNDQGRVFIAQSISES